MTKNDLNSDYLTKALKETKTNALITKTTLSPVKHMNKIS